MLEISTFMEMQQAGFAWDGLAVMSVLHACQQLGLAQPACRALEYMKNLDDNNNRQRSTAGWHVAGQRPPLTKPDAVAYRLAISACARGNAWQEGIRLLQELQDMG